MPHPRAEQLAEMRGFLQQAIPNFPSWNCQVAARFLKEIGGFPELMGQYHAIGWEHAWNIDRQEKCYIDLTTARIIVPFSSNHGRLYTDYPEWTLFQREYSDSDFLGTVRMLTNEWNAQNPG